MNRKLKKALKKAYEAPAPIRKESFLSTLPLPHTSKLQFCLSQIGYIRKRFWLLSALILLSTYIFMINYANSQEITGIVSACLPLLTLTGMSEIKKSDTYNMNELEMSCKYDLGRILLLRLSIIGTFHLLLLLISLIVLKEYSHYETLRYVLYAVTPFLLSSLLSFWITNHIQSKDSLYICSGVTILVSLFVFLLNLSSTAIYADKFVVFWQISFLAILVLLIKEIHLLLIERIESWNFV